jgi:hypothetical protein
MCTYSRIRDALVVYEKLKNTETMKTLSKVEKIMVYLNVISFLLKPLDPWK